MWSFAALLALEALAPLAATQNVVSMGFEKRHVKQSKRVSKRAHINEVIGNGEILYYANVSIGTPPQLISLQLDTGSSDVWMTATGTSFCLESSYNCAGGTFSQSSSTTFNPLDSPSFSIQYVDQTGSSGIYFTDQFTIAGTTLNRLQMGLAEETTIGTGIMGVGFASDESVCSGVATCATYPSVIDQMYSQGKISRRAYSLWLDDLESNTGHILFGGVDSAQYLPPLVSLPIQNDAQSGTITSFTVSWTNLTLNTPNGIVTAGLWPDQGPLPAILDSGTTLMVLPTSIANAMYAQFGAAYSHKVQSYVAACSLARSTALFEFQFGGSNGPLVRVPISEFLLPIQTTAGTGYTYGGVEYCQLGVEGDDSAPILLGDTFLRSAYVVYDLDNNEISIAQSNFNPSGSQISEIPSGSAAIPGVSSTATGAAVTQSATAGDGFGLGISSVFYSATASETLNPVTGTPLTAYTATNTYVPTGINGQAGSRSSSGLGAVATAAPGLIAAGLGAAALFL